jgi:hypothetical protein
MAADERLAARRHVRYGLRDLPAPSIDVAAGRARYWWALEMANGEGYATGPW